MAEEGRTGWRGGEGVLWHGSLAVNIEDHGYKISFSRITKIRDPLLYQKECLSRGLNKAKSRKAKSRLHIANRIPRSL